MEDLLLIKLFLYYSVFVIDGLEYVIELRFYIYSSVLFQLLLFIFTYYSHYELWIEVFG